MTLSITYTLVLYIKAKSDINISKCGHDVALTMSELTTFINREVRLLLNVRLEAGSVIVSLPHTFLMSFELLL